jgi:hypothetical protein
MVHCCGTWPNTVAELTPFPFVWYAAEIKPGFGLMVVCKTILSTLAM